MADRSAVCSYVGVYYPTGADVVDNGLAGYVLEGDDLRAIAAQLPTLPITFEHQGIRNAVSGILGDHKACSAANVVAGLKASAREDVLHAPVGVVVAAWQAACGAWLCWFAVDSARFPRLCAMIDSGAMRGLSLSHLHGENVTALEVSICVRPARPKCFVLAGPFDTPCQVQRYKEVSIVRGTQAATMASTTTPTAAMVPTPPAIDAVISAMTPEHRVLISAAFDDMAKQLEATAAQNAQLKKSYHQIENAAKVDKGLLTRQIETFLGQLDETTMAQFGLSIDGCKAEMVQQEDACAIRRGVDRMLMCCNHVMMTRGAEANKRKRHYDDVGARPAEAMQPDAAQTATTLFDPAASNSPADELRAALSAFD